MVVLDGQLEMFAHLVAIKNLAYLKTNFVFELGRFGTASHFIGNLGKSRFGGIEEGISLMSTLVGIQGIVAGDKALTGEPIRMDFSQILVIEQ